MCVKNDTSKWMDDDIFVLKQGISFSENSKNRLQALIKNKKQKKNF